MNGIADPSMHTGILYKSKDTLYGNIQPNRKATRMHVVANDCSKPITLTSAETRLFWGRISDQVPTLL